MITKQINGTYLFFIHQEQPVNHVVDVINSLTVRFTGFWLMCEVDSRNAPVFVTLAKQVFVVEEGELLDDVVHDEVGIDGRLVAYDLLVSFAKLHNLLDVKALVRVQLEHAYNDPAEFRAVLFTQWRKLAFRDSLKQIIQRQILFVILAEGASEHA